jgi:hypothetical protein
MCDTRFQFAYLIKYTCGTEEKSEAKVFYTSDKKVVEVVGQDIKNLKISSQKYLDDQQKKKNPGPLIREISETEMVWVLLGFPYVYTTCTYIHVSTHDAGNRTTILKTKRGTARNMDRTSNPVAVECRKEFRGNDEQRCFTKNQEALIRDFDTNQFVPDKVHGFSVRPPELMVFDRLVDYTKWFQPVAFKKKTMEFSLPQSLADSPLLDGCFRHVKMVSSTVQEVHDYLVDLESKVADWPADAERPPFPDTYLSPSVSVTL